MVGEWSARSSVRARDVDREYAMGLLREASVDGQLSGEEFEQRLSEAMRAKTLGDLAALVGDLQQSRSAQPRLPAKPTRPRGRRSVAAFVCTAAALLLIGIVLDGRDQANLSGEAVRAVPARTVQDHSLVVDPTYHVQLRNLGLPERLPIPVGAEFQGGNWVSAGNDGSKTTYRWHLTYLLRGFDAGGVAAFYRANVRSEHFGDTVDVQQPSPLTTELRWADALGPRALAAYTLQLRTTGQPDDDLRVELDVTTAVRPQLERPDVPGELGVLLRAQNVTHAGAMTYDSSKVSQPIGDEQTSCLLEQGWSATLSDFRAIEAVARSIGATVTEQGDRHHVRFSETKPDCFALAF